MNKKERNTNVLAYWRKSRKKRTEVSDPLKEVIDRIRNLSDKDALILLEGLIRGYLVDSLNGNQEVIELYERARGWQRLRGAVLFYDAYPCPVLVVDTPYDGDFDQLKKDALHAGVKVDWEGMPVLSGYVEADRAVAAAKRLSGGGMEWPSDDESTTRSKKGVSPREQLIEICTLLRQRNIKYITELLEELERLGLAVRVGDRWYARPYMSQN